MKIEVLTLFPELVEQVGKFGMPRVAVERGALQLSVRQLRDTAGNRWRRVWVFLRLARQPGPEATAPVQP